MNARQLLGEMQRIRDRYAETEDAEELGIGMLDVSDSFRQVNVLTVNTPEYREAADIYNSLLEDANEQLHPPLRPLSYRL